MLFCVFLRGHFPYAKGVSPRQQQRLLLTALEVACARWISRSALYQLIQRGEAQAKIDQLKADILDGRDVGAPTQKVPNYLRQWPANVVKLRVRVSTYASYELNVRRISPYLKSRRLDTLRPAHVKDALAAMMRDGYSPPTRHTAFCAWRYATPRNSD
jgi:hypothetical protein